VERTRELGLLRTVGTTREHLARNIRVEALLTALVGGVLGFGLAAATARDPPPTHRCR
jgi:putative ABC transport system permease protein